jgi:polynucleotide 5'-triphosphatase
MYQQIYIPVHDRPPYFANLPTPPHSYTEPVYGTPDTDPSKPFSWSMSGSDSQTEEYGEPVDQRQRYEENAQAGPSRKRIRGDYDERDHHNGHGEGQREPSNGHQVSNHGTPDIMPSIFGISPRNEFTKMVGEFIMANARGKQNIEVQSFRCILELN